MPYVVITGFRDLRDEDDPEKYSDSRHVPDTFVVPSFAEAQRAVTNIVSHLEEQEEAELRPSPFVAEIHYKTVDELLDEQWVHPEDRAEWEALRGG